MFKIFLHQWLFQCLCLCFTTLSREYRMLFEIFTGKCWKVSGKEQSITLMHAELTLNSASVPQHSMEFMFLWSKFRFCMQFSFCKINFWNCSHHLCSLCITLTGVQIALLTHSVTSPVASSKPILNWLLSPMFLNGVTNKNHLKYTQMDVNGLIFCSNLFLFYRSIVREFNFTVDFHVKLMWVKLVHSLLMMLFTCMY